MKLPPAIHALSIFTIVVLISMLVIQQFTIRELRSTQDKTIARLQETSDRWREAATKWEAVSNRFEKAALNCQSMVKDYLGGLTISGDPNNSHGIVIHLDREVGK